ncbi:MAG: hypothetical protein D3903_02950 [Candidatus Electrothrix sp. GM3_4]|nr:hypothetical protein [Candidatus Electrothrix sp. GM3_4]
MQVHGARYINPVYQPDISVMLFHGTAAESLLQRPGKITTFLKLSCASYGQHVRLISKRMMKKRASVRIAFP